MRSEGLAIAFFRKSIYATGGVIGVFKAPSPATPGVCGRRLNVADMGERGSSDGKAGDLREVGTALAMLDVEILASFVDVVSGGDGRAAGELSGLALDFVMTGIGVVAASVIVVIVIVEGEVICNSIIGVTMTTVRIWYSKSSDGSKLVANVGDRVGRQKKTDEIMFTCYHISRRI